MTLLQPLLRRRLARRGRIEPGYLEAMSERFGVYAPDAAGASGAGTAVAAHAWVWVHAVSLGETRAAAVLIKAMRERMPGMRLLLTHGTATGRAEGRSLLRDGDVQVWLPWDAPGAVDRFLLHFRPRVGLLLETEVWPVLAARCQALAVPLLLVNGRLSDKSLQNALRLSWLARPAYAALTAVYAQTESDAARFVQMGAAVCGVFGNIKFDAQPDPLLLERGRAWLRHWNASQPDPKPVILFASSREGEELLFVEALSRLAAHQRASVQWLIVPRHPQRFDDVAGLLAAAGLTISRRSLWSSQGPAQENVADIWLGDSLGEMPVYFSMSALALLGGSFLPLGGQNLMEAAACACPVVMGPHTFNFADAAQNSADMGSALRVTDMDEALICATDLLLQPQRLDAARQATASFVRAHQGAVQRTVDGLTLVLRPRDGDALSGPLQA